MTYMLLRTALYTFAIIIAGFIFSLFLEFEEDLRQRLLHRFYETSIGQIFKKYNLFPNVFMITVVAGLLFATFKMLREIIMYII